MPNDTELIPFTIYFKDRDEMTIHAARCEYRPGGWGSYEYALFGMKGDIGEMYFREEQVERVEPEEEIEEKGITKDMLKNWSTGASN